MAKTKLIIAWSHESVTATVYNCHLRFKSGQFLMGLRLKSGHPPPKVAILEGLNIDEFVFVPES